MEPQSSRDIGVSAPSRYEGQVLYTNSWAVVAGFDRYLDTRIPRLEYAEADARALAALLPSVGFPRENVTLLLGSRDEVTPQSFTAFLNDDLNPKMELTDRLLVYIAGHGVCTLVHGEQRGHLLMPHSELIGRWPTAENPHLERNPKGALEMRQLLDVVRGLQARHRLLLMDACFSGYAARAVEHTGPLAAADPRIRRWLSEPVTQVLTAGRSGQRAFESPLYRHGIFTHYVLKALEGSADRDGRGVITFSQLAGYVKDRVAAEEGDQDPQSDQHGEGEYLLFVKPPEKAQGLVVSQAGSGSHTSIGGAIRAARPGERILIRPGVYRECIVLDREVELVGDGRREDCVIEGLEGAPAVEALSPPSRIWKAPRAMVRGLTIRTVDQNIFGSTVRTAGGELLVEDCDISFKVLVSSGRLTCRQSKIHDGPGITVVDGAATVEDCEICDSAFGMDIISGSETVVRRTRIHDNSKVGLWIRGSGRPTIEECELYGHAASCIVVQDAAAPLIRRCRIHDNQNWGVEIRERGAATIEDCDISGSGADGLVIAGKATPQVRRTKIRNGKGRGVVVSENGAGIIEDCEITGNAKNGVGVHDAANPTIRRTQVAESQNCGIYFQGHATGTLEDCDILRTHEGVLIYGEANPAVRRSKIHGQSGRGVVAWEKGAGTIESCEIFGNDSVCVQVAGDGRTTIRACHIHDTQSHGVMIGDRAAPTVDDCDVHATRQMGLKIAGSAAPVVRQSRFHDGKRCGISVTDHAGGIIENCTVWAHPEAQVAISSDGNPAIRRTTIRDGENDGVYAADSGAATLEDCDIASNFGHGATIRDRGNLTIRRTKIHEGDHNGILVWGNATGTVEDGEIFGNDEDGVQIQGDGSLTAVRTKIHDNHQFGVSLVFHARADLKQCDITSNGKNGISLEHQASLSAKVTAIWGHAEYAAIRARDNAQAVVESCRLTNEGGSVDSDHALQVAGSSVVPKDYEELWKKFRDLGDRAYVGQREKFRDDIRRRWQKLGYK